MSGRIPSPSSPSIEPRGLPLDWRVKLNYVQADYSSAGGSTPIYSLRPPNTSRTPMAVDRWRMPGCCRKAAVRQLRSEPQLELKLRYSLTLLKPHEFRLPTDGKRHAVAESRLLQRRRSIEPGNRIDVDCFSGFDHPAQISAELNGDSREPRLRPARIIAPRWTRWPFGQRVKLAIGSPRLAKARHITVTAWTLAGYFR